MSRDGSGRPVEMRETLGLAGLTMNAMALIAPGAFLWLTFYMQAAAGESAPSMWAGIAFALLLCLATAVCYAELAKLYPSTGSSYYFAEQSFLNHEKVWKYARISKFIVGWGSHLYYWIYPGVMVGLMGIFSGYVVGTLYPGFMSASNPGPLFMMAVAVAFSLVIAYLAQRGITGSPSVHLAINVIQISALIVFSVLVLGYRLHHPAGSQGRQFDAVTGTSYSYEFAAHTTIIDGAKTDSIVRNARHVPQPKLDAGGAPVPYIVRYPSTDSEGKFLAHNDAGSVTGTHRMSWIFLQATIAILILVGFESVTSMGAEAKNARRDIPIAVVVSLLVQGAFCYLFEYFAVDYFLNSGYSMQSAARSAAPIGDIMILVGDAAFGDGRGRIFMLAEALTVFLAIVTTTLCCISNGARVTYAMGKDNEVPEHFGMLHGKNLTPHHAIWTLAGISAVVGCVAVSMVFEGAGAPSDATIQALPPGLWSSFGYTTHNQMAELPNSLLTMALASNFGTFLLYGLSCVTCMVAYHRHPKFSALRHFLIPVFGLAASLACMAAYLAGPLLGIGAKLEPLLALGIAAVWAIYGGIYFVVTSRSTGRTTLVTRRT